MTVSNTSATICLSLLLLITSAAARADVIHGEIIVSGGGATPTGTDSNGDGSVSLGEATGVDFTIPGLVFGTSGDFGAVPLFSLVSFADFAFNPPTGVDPLWTFSGGGLTFSFAAGNFSVVSQSDVFLNIVGSATISVTGFDDTAGGWSFTMTTQDGHFGWLSATVPEPGTMLLFGMGLVGMGLSRRRRKV